MKAIKIIEKGKAEIRDVPIPALRDDYVLVKVKAVALNPTDWKHIRNLALTGCTVGCDFAGTIVSIGPAVTKPWKVGDRIAGFTHGSNSVQPEDGCFAEYCVAKGDLGVKIPENLPIEEAATLGVGITTVGQALYQSLGLPLPKSGEMANRGILIYGASSATGTLAVQFAKLSGCAPIITTSSPKNFGLLKGLGADVTLDYNDPECAKKVRDAAGGELTLALDCISRKETAEFCASTIGPQGGMVTYLLGVNHEREDVKAGFTLGYTVTGEGFKMGEREWVPKEDDFEFGKMFWGLAERLLEEGKVKAHPVEAGEGGLEGLFEGLERMREGRVSGRKLVYLL